MMMSRHVRSLQEFGLEEYDRDGFLPVPQPYTAACRRTPFEARPQAVDHGRQISLLLVPTSPGEDARQEEHQMMEDIVGGHVKAD